MNIHKSEYEFISLQPINFHHHHHHPYIHIRISAASLSNRIY